MNAEEFINAPSPINANSAKMKGKGICESIIIKTKSGKTYNLGSPDSFLFPLRRAIYVWKRKMELNNG